MEYNDNHHSPTPESHQQAEHLDASATDPVSAVLARLGLGKAVGIQKDQLRAALKSPDRSVRMAAIRTLGTLGGRAPVALLVAALSDTEWSVRAAALLALGKLREKAPVESLLASLEDEHESVRAAATWALGMLKERAPLESLLAALHDPSWSVREAAALALGGLGERIPLSTAQTDDDNYVREAAELALQQTNATSKPQVGRGRRDQIYRVPRSGAGHLSTALARLIEQLKAWRVREISSIHVQEEDLTLDDESIGAANKSLTSLQQKTLAKRSLFLRVTEGSLVALILVGMLVAWLALATRPHGSSLGHSSTPESSALIYHGHVGGMYQLAWSPNGTQIASVGADGTIQVWDAITGHTLATYKGHSGTVLAIVWVSPTYLLVASAKTDKTVQVWDAASGYIILTTPQLPYIVTAAAWSPDATHLAFGSSDSVQVWSVTTKSEVSSYTSHAGRITALAWSLNGKDIASASYDKTIQVWDVATRHTLASYRGHMNDASVVNVIAWSPDGGHIASGSQNVQVWDATSGHALFTYHGHLYGVNAIVWSPNGKQITSGSSDDTVQVWNAATGRPIFTYHGHTDAVTVVAWSPDGKRIASASIDGTVQVWRPIN